MSTQERDSPSADHPHQFAAGNRPAEASTRRVIALTATMMVVELTAGWLYHSIALLADGWHMGTHVAALGLTVAAYALARRWAGDGRFAFGTWRIEVLGGYTSAVVLGLVALYMAGASVQRLLQPLPILYDQALVVATAGLAVNLVSAWLLRGHGHSLADDPESDDHADLNLRSAYLHVLADATTSLLAILALLGGRLLGWGWLDPVMGLVGAGVITVWAWGLLRATSRILLDREMDHPLVERIRTTVQADGRATLTDLHLWRVGPGRFACIVGVRTADPRPPEHFRALLRPYPQLAHLTVEVDCRATAPEGPATAETDPDDPDQHRG